MLFWLEISFLQVGKMEGTITCNQCRDADVLVGEQGSDIKVEVEVRFAPFINATHNAPQCLLPAKPALNIDTKALKLLHCSTLVCLDQVVLLEGNTPQPWGLTWITKIGQITKNCKVWHLICWQELKCLCVNVECWFGRQQTLWGIKGCVPSCGWRSHALSHNGKEKWRRHSEVDGQPLSWHHKHCSSHQNNTWPLQMGHQVSRSLSSLNWQVKWCMDTQCPLMELAAFDFATISEQGKYRAEVRYTQLHTQALLSYS